MRDRSPEEARAELQRAAREVRDAWQLLMEYVHEADFNPNVAMSLLSRAHEAAQQYQSTISYRIIDLIPGTLSEQRAVLQNPPPADQIPKKPKG